MTEKDIIKALNLKPLDGEGGYFIQCYKSEYTVNANELSPHYKPEQKPIGTAIQYLITPNSYSRLHRLPTDEVYHFYLGSPVQMLLIPPNENPFTVILGQDILNNMRLQLTVPAHWWQGSRLVSGGEWALLGTTMSPGYTDTDYEDAPAEELINKYPKAAHEIEILTRI